MTTLFPEPCRKPLPADAQIEDHRAAVIKGTIGSIPILGGALVEELGLLLAPPLSRRRDEWFSDLARRLHDLETRVAGFRFEDLANNEQFVSVTVRAAQIALRTHQQEKRQALRDAAVNVAVGTEPDEGRQTLFLSLLDRYDKLHLRLLRFFQKSFQARFSDTGRVCGSPHADLYRSLKHVA